MLTCSGYVHSDRLTFYAGAPKLPMLDGGQYGLHALDRLYRCREGWIMLAALRSDEWECLARGVEHSEWLADPRFEDAARRMENDTLLGELLTGIFAADEAMAWETSLSAAGVPVAAVSGSFEQFMVDNKLVDPAESPGFGTYFAFQPRMRFSASASSLGRPSNFGEYTLPLLRELDYGEDDIADMVAKGVVRIAKGASGTSR